MTIFTDIPSVFLEVDDLESVINCGEISAYERIFLNELIEGESKILEMRVFETKKFGRVGRVEYQNSMIDVTRFINLLLIWRDIKTSSLVSRNFLAQVR
jgi:hypothetical protein